MDAVSFSRTFNQVQNFGQQDGKVTESSPEQIKVAEVLAKELTAEGIMTIVTQVVDQTGFEQITSALDKAAIHVTEELGKFECSGILTEVREEVMAASNRAQPMTIFELIALIMEISLRDRDSQRKEEEVIKHTLCAAAIAIQQLGTEAIKSAYTGSILMAVGSLIDGFKKVAEPGPYKEATNKLATVSSILGLHGANANVIGILLDSIKDPARNQLSRTVELVEGKWQMGEACDQERKQQQEQMVKNLAQLALMLASMVEIMRGAFRKR